MLPNVTLGRSVQLASVDAIFRCAGQYHRQASEGKAKILGLMFMDNKKGEQQLPALAPRRLLNCQH